MPKTTKDRKKLLDRLNKSPIICGRRFKIVVANAGGAEFHTVHPKTGGGVISIGNTPPDEYYQLTNVIHEILELVLTLREHRCYESDTKIVFNFTHDEFIAVCLDFTRGLLETGLLDSIKDGGNSDDIPDRSTSGHI